MMFRLRRRSVAVGAAGGLALAMLTGVVGASAADHASDINAIGTSPESPWTATTDGTAAVVGDATRGSVLELTAIEGTMSRILHYMTSGAFPAVDAAYEARTTWGRFIDGTIDPDSTLPRAKAATADVAVFGGAQLFLDMELSYLDAEGERATTVLACALPATGSWSTLDLSECNYHETDWKLTSWTTTEEWTYRTDSIAPKNHTYPVGVPISGVSNGQASAYPIAIGFRVEGPAGATARIDEFVIRDSVLSFTASPTTLVFTATTHGVAVPGVSVTVSGTVSPSTAAGTVRFADGGTTVAESVVVDGAFSATVANLAAGAHTLTASFLPADEDAYVASTADPITVTVNSKAAPSGPPAATTQQLLALPGAITVPQGGFTQSGATPNDDGSLNGGAPFEGELPWSDSTDSFVDLYGFSTPVYLGTFPVVNGVVQLSGVDLSAFSGDHHLVFVGQTSSTVAIMAVRIVAALAPTGAEPWLPAISGSVLLLLGSSLLMVSRRRAHSTAR